MRKNFKNVTASALLCAALLCPALLCAGCGGEEELERIPNIYDTAVCFRVNADRNGFENIGVGTATIPKEEFTAEAMGGQFTKSHGMPVYNTMGTLDGDWIVPWFVTGRWDRYIDIGWIEFCENTGNLIAASDEWTVEVVFAFPNDHPADMADQWLWAFADNSVASTGAYPNTYIGFNWRETVLFAVDVPRSTGGRAGFNSADDWAAGVPYRSQASGFWKHLVTTKDADGLISNYLDGFLVNYNYTQFRPSETAPWESIPYPDFQEGAFSVRTFGKTLYGSWVENASGVNTAYGNDISRAGLYHFAIDNKSWDSNEVYNRYEKSLVGRGTLIYWP